TTKFSRSVNAVDPTDARAMRGNIFNPSITRKTISDRPRKLSQACRLTSIAPSFDCVALVRARPVRGEGAGWRKRMGIEPTHPAERRDANGFEVRESHQAPGASASDYVGSRVEGRASGVLSCAPSNRGAVAQLGERLNGIQEVDGSIPFSSTIAFRLNIHRGQLQDLTGDLRPGGLGRGDSNPPPRTNRQPPQLAA